MLKHLLKCLADPAGDFIRDQLGLWEEGVSKNIRTELQRRALQSTADYIDSRMAHVDSVPTRSKLLDLALSRMKPGGLVCEFGVFSGKSINHIARQTDSTVYGFDSFEGLPERWIDGFPAGHFARKDLPQVRENVKLIKGRFEETLPIFVSQHPESVSFLNIDCDLYSATTTVLTLLGPKIGKGTVIVFDEYFNYPGWQKGEFKAFQEFIDASAHHYEYLSYNYTDEQSAVIITD
jgi:hypothetical protein